MARSAVVAVVPALALAVALAVALTLALAVAAPGIGPGTAHAAGGTGPAAGRVTGQGHTRVSTVTGSTGRPPAAAWRQRTLRRLRGPATHTRFPTARSDAWTGVRTEVNGNLAHLDTRLPRLLSVVDARWDLAEALWFIPRAQLSEAGHALAVERALRGADYHLPASQHYLEERAPWQRLDPGSTFLNGGLAALHRRLARKAEGIQGLLRVGEAVPHRLGTFADAPVGRYRYFIVATFDGEVHVIDPATSDYAFLHPSLSPHGPGLDRLVSGRLKAPVEFLPTTPHSFGRLAAPPVPGAWVTASGREAAAMIHAAPAGSRFSVWVGRGGDTDLLYVSRGDGPDTVEVEVAGEAHHRHSGLTEARLVAFFQGSPFVGLNRTS
jgi:hypothetical protein